MADLPDILKASVAKGASDIQIVPGKPPMMRIHGEMQPLSEVPPLTAEETKRMIFSVLYEDQRSRFEADWELDTSLSVPNVSRFRVNVYQQRKGVGAAFRAIPSKIPAPQEIGLMPSVSTAVRCHVTPPSRVLQSSARNCRPSAASAGSS